MLQGGGALGSYQASVHEALTSSEYTPDWVAGVSIGAPNAVIIAGNAPADRFARLRTFWEEVTSRTAWWPAELDPTSAEVRRKTSAAAALLCGQPRFFLPRVPIAWWSAVQPPNQSHNHCGARQWQARGRSVEAIGRKELHR